MDKTMFILLLDSSGSMEGKRWQSLMQEFEKFVKTFHNDHVLKMNSTISIIVYNGDAHLVCENKCPSKNLVQLIKFQGGDTDFEKPMTLAY